MRFRRNLGIDYNFLTAYSILAAFLASLIYTFSNNTLFASFFAGTMYALFFGILHSVLFYYILEANRESYLRKFSLLPREQEGYFLWILICVVTFGGIIFLIAGLASVPLMDSDKTVSSGEIYLDGMNFTFDSSCSGDDNVLAGSTAFDCDLEFEDSDEFRESYEGYLIDYAWLDMDGEVVKNGSVLGSERDFSNSFEVPSPIDTGGYTLSLEKSSSLESVEEADLSDLEFSSGINVYSEDIVSLSNYRVLSIVFSLFVLITGWIGVLSLIYKLNRDKYVSKNKAYRFNKYSIDIFILVMILTGFLLLQYHRYGSIVL